MLKVIQTCAVEVNINFYPILKTAVNIISKSLDFVYWQTGSSELTVIIWMKTNDFAYYKQD